ncbi:MAG: rod shape-determining protein MreD [Trueperaceae bacterium]|nr:rod shape-determining protein MreD [Trueperaceae bacterium]
MQLVLFYLLLLVAQGTLAVLVAPLPAPDLFLIAMLTLLWRLPAWQMVLVGYGIGLLQDIVGHGNLGLHALGLAGGALLASFVKSLVSQAGFAERLLTALSALVGKWLVFAALLGWLGAGANPLDTVLRVAPLEALFTILLSMVVLPVAAWLMEQSSVLRKELL